MFLPRQRLPLLLPGDPVVVRPQPQGLDGQTDVGFQSGNAPILLLHGSTERQSPSGRALACNAMGKRFVRSHFGFCWGTPTRSSIPGFTLCSDREQPGGPVVQLIGCVGCSTSSCPEDALGPVGLGCPVCPSQPRGRLAHCQDPSQAEALFLCSCFCLCLSHRQLIPPGPAPSTPPLSPVSLCIGPANSLSLFLSLFTQR